MKRSLKAAALVFLVASISIVSYSAFTSRIGWFHCPECHSLTRTVAQICETHDSPGNSSGSDTPTNLSHIVFGIGGSSKTWKDRRQYSELWWQPNATRGFVWLEREPDPDSPWPEKSPPYRVSSDWTRFKYTTSPSAVRIARIISDSFRVGLANVRWFVMGDDDTVFFPDNLVTVLRKYDHRSMYYIGGNSESVEQDVMHSYEMAFGGGGFAISYPLAAELARAMDGCLDRYYNFYGSDQRVWACVSEIGVPLTKEPGFHQVDIRGDPYGLLAAHPLAPLVSLHHLDHVKSLFPNMTQHDSLVSLARAYSPDPPRILQQSLCYDRKLKWSVSVSWGYTVQLYPWLLTANQLETPLRTFQTWRSWSDGPFTFNTRPMSPDPCKEPFIYYLDDVKEVWPGQTLTTYQKKNVEKKCKGEDARASRVERIVVSVMKMNPRDWNKAPQRQCCDMGGLKNGGLKLRIRSCERGESP